MTRTIIFTDESRVAPTQNETNPYAYAISMEAGSAGVPRNDVKTATPSQIQRGNSWRSCGLSADAESAASGGAYGFTDS